MDDYEVPCRPETVVGNEVHNYVRSTSQCIRCRRVGRPWSLRGRKKERLLRHRMCRLRPTPLLESMARVGASMLNSGLILITTWLGSVELLGRGRRGKSEHLALGYYNFDPNRVFGAGGAYSAKSRIFRLAVHPDVRPAAQSDLLLGICVR